MVVRDRRDFERAHTRHHEEPVDRFTEGLPQHQLVGGECVCGAAAQPSGTGHGYTLCSATKREIVEEER